MQRVTKEEAEAFRRELSTWRRLAEVHPLMIGVEEKAQLYVVSQGALKVWREAFVGMSCAQLTHAHRFKLGDDPPDFTLDYGDHQRSFEIVTIIPKDWKITHEYDGHAANLNAGEPTPLRTLSHAESEAEMEALFPDLEAQISAKMAKPYPQETILVADVLHGIDFSTDVGPMKRVASIAAGGLKVFSEVWVRRGAAIIRVTKESRSLVSSLYLSVM